MRKVPRSHRAKVTPAKNGSLKGTRRQAPTDPPNYFPVFRTLLDNLEIGVAQVTSSGLVLFANQRFKEILGSGRANPTNVDLAQFIAPGSWVSLSEALNQAVHKPVQGTMNVITDDGPGAERVIHLSLWPLRDEIDTTIGLVATEVTDLVQTKKALEESEASLQSVSAKLLRVQDEERRRLARDLHDTTGQELSVVIIALEHLAREMGGDAQKANVLSDGVRQLRKVEKDIRTLSYVLHPPLLDEMGVAVALRWYLDGYSKRTGIQVETEIPDSVPRFELEKETALFRVIQESLTNVYRHASSPRVRVRLVVESASIKVLIEDQGHGFDTDSAKPKSGVGIQSMKGRLQIVGGNLQVRSSHLGTTVIASVPIKKISGSDADEAAAAAAAAAAQSVRRRILIADDHYVARRGIRTLFDLADDLEICGEAADGVEAVRQTKELNPDLVIMDLSMPKLGGLAAAGRIREAGLETKILVYTSHSMPQLERSVRLAGCDGYVVKSNAAHDLLRATRQVLNGGKFYRPEIISEQSA